MRKPKEKIKLETKKVYLGQYGGTEDETVIGEFETIENQHAKYANSIGSFMISFAELEDAVDSSLATAINERAYEPGYRVIKYLGFRDKINLLYDCHSAYVRLLTSEASRLRLLGKLKILHNKLCELSEFRNKVTHANWQSLDVSGFVRTKVIENRDGVGMQLEKIKMTPSVLIKFRKQNEALVNKMEVFIEKAEDAHSREYSRIYKKISSR
jgi:hypothetical protein